MMIKEVAEEIGVHPSTVSRAVPTSTPTLRKASSSLRYFFSEAVQGPSGSETPLLIVKRRVKKMIEEEDTLIRSPTNKSLLACRPKAFRSPGALLPSTGRT